MTAFDDLLFSLRWLDGLLERAVTHARDIYGAAAVSDPYRGLYVSEQDVHSVLARPPGDPLFASDADLPDLSAHSNRLRWLKESFALCSFDIAVIVIALAPELDIRYQRLYSYLQDDVTRKHPTVDLILNLLCDSAASKLKRRSHFASSAPLITQTLIHLGDNESSFLNYAVVLDDQIVRFLLNNEGIDSRLAAFCKLVTPSEQAIDATLKATLLTLAEDAAAANQPLRLYMHGLSSSDRRTVVEGLSASLGMPLLVARAALVPEPDFKQLIKSVFREAQLHHVLLYLEDVDTVLAGDSPAIQRDLLEALVADQGITILSGQRPWTPSDQVVSGVLSIELSLPSFAERKACWRVHLEGADIDLDDANVNVLTGRYRLAPHQIEEAVLAARNNARWRAARSKEREVTHLDDLFEGARAQCGHKLAALANKIEPIYQWNDIVVPDTLREQLEEICQRVIHQEQVLSDWGFARKLARGIGVNALFAGVSGTGKTMAAEIIARELQLDLYKIDLSMVVSKYIGETEKNLSQLFEAARRANAILFFDEADALFGKRSEVHDSHDRYANIEISYLLQKMEQYEGLAILATNLRDNMDDAFTRRLQFVLEFPFPDEAHRCQIWQTLFPPEAPRDPAIDFGWLARQFRLSGGNIKNVVMAAAFLAASDGRPIGMSHLIQATRREYQKMGKVISAAEFGGNDG